MFRRVPCPAIILFIETMLFKIEVGKGKSAARIE